MAVGYFDRRVTLDIDALCRAGDLVERDAAEIAPECGLTADWLNNHALGYVSFVGQDEWTELFTAGPMTVFVTSAPMVLSMKLAANRGRTTTPAPTLEGVHVVVVEDERRLNDLVVRYLNESGITADGYLDGRSGVAAARRAGVDAVVLDLMLPDLRGLTVCRQLRREGYDVPILILTARGSVQERVEGLDAGADDYLVKPFSLDELAARLRAVHRRRESPSERLIVGDLVLDVAQVRVWRGDVELELAGREFDMLHVLMANAGRVVTRAKLLEQVWDGEADLHSNSIEVHMSRLRGVIDRPFGTVTITTVRGIGYRLERSP